MDDLLTLEQAAQAIHRNVRTLQRWIHAGKLAPVSTDNGNRFRLDDVKHVAAELTSRYSKKRKNVDRPKDQPRADHPKQQQT